MKTSSPPSTAAPRTIQSVDRALDILQALAAHSGGLTLSALAATLGLHPQTAQSLVRTLQARHWVVQAGRGQPYGLGPAMLALTQQWLGGNGLASAARNRVEALSQTVGEYVLLAELRGQTLMPLVERRAERTLMLGAAEVYGSNRLHDMATGKVLLAYLEPERRNRLVASLALTPRGPQAVRSHAAFLRQLEAIQRDGYVICREEAGEQIAALAMPVRDASGAVRAALGLSLPLSRFAAGQEKRLLKELRAAAADIEQAWGWRRAAGLKT
ncbi:MAG: IclR family transcriptional regulator [Lentisphaeria bacterium]